MNAKNRMIAPKLFTVTALAMAASAYAEPEERWAQTSVDPQTEATADSEAYRADDMQGLDDSDPVSTPTRSTTYDDMDGTAPATTSTPSTRDIGTSDTTLSDPSAGSTPGVPDQQGDVRSYPTRDMRDTTEDRMDGYRSDESSFDMDSSTRSGQETLSNVSADDVELTPDRAIVETPAMSSRPEDIEVSDGGVSYVTGGIGETERENFQETYRNFSFKLSNIAKDESGAYVSDVDVEIMDEGGSTVLETTTDGPWLVADLPQGNYTVQASKAGDEMEREVSIDGSGQQTQLEMRWESVDMGMQGDQPGNL